MTELDLAEATMLRSNACGGVGVLISLASLSFYLILPEQVQQFQMVWLELV